MGASAADDSLPLYKLMSGNDTCNLPPSHPQALEECRETQTDIKSTQQAGSPCLIDSPTRRQR